MSFLQLKGTANVVLTTPIYLNSSQRQFSTIPRLFKYLLKSKSVSYKK